MSDQEIVAQAKGNASICFMCSWTVQDFEKNGKLTDWPFDSNGKGEFPRDGKERHAKLEKGLTV